MCFVSGLACELQLQWSTNLQYPARLQTPPANTLSNMDEYLLHQFFEHFIESPAMDEW